MTRLEELLCKAFISCLVLRAKMEIMPSSINDKTIGDLLFQSDVAGLFVREKGERIVFLANRNHLLHIECKLKPDGRRNRNVVFVFNRFFCEGDIYVYAYAKRYRFYIIPEKRDGTWWKDHYSESDFDAKAVFSNALAGKIEVSTSFESMEKNRCLLLYFEDYNVEEDKEELETIIENLCQTCDEVDKFLKDIQNQ